MKIGLFFGVYEAEKSFANNTLGSILEILKDHDVHVLILDDASQSHIGRELAELHGHRPRLSIEVLRLEQSSGFRGSMDRTIAGFRHLTSLSKTFDYVIRLDADLFIVRKDLARIFDPDLLPAQGMVGSFARFRIRDYVQLFMDLLPFGFRRRSSNGVIDNRWELRRFSPVWWWDIGLRALWNGFRMKYLTGSFQIIAGGTLQAMKEEGWLDRKPLPSLGLVFGEDVATNLMVKALKHPLIDASELILDWSCNLAVNQWESDPFTVKRRGHYVIHPLKGDDWSVAMRKSLAPGSVSQTSENVLIIISDLPVR